MKGDPESQGNTQTSNRCCLMKENVFCPTKTTREPHSKLIPSEQNRFLLFYFWLVKPPSKQITPRPLSFVLCHSPPLFAPQDGGRHLLST